MSFIPKSRGCKGRPAGQCQFYRIHAAAGKLARLTPAWIDGMINVPQASRAVAASPRGMSRKVRAPQGTMSGNTRGGATCQIGPQKHTTPQGARVKRRCKRPPAPQWCGGQATLIGSKAKQEREAARLNIPRDRDIPRGRSSG